MINKMNKKGFTLIEMLVVIAIIAILVSIIIPTVTAATDKAACATNAANLRSLKAELTTAMLTSDSTTGTTVRGFTVKSNKTIGGAFDGSITFKPVAGVTATSGTVAAEYKNNDVVVTYGGKDIDTWAKYASGEVAIPKGTN